MSDQPTSDGYSKSIHEDGVRMGREQALDEAIAIVESQFVYAGDELAVGGGEGQHNASLETILSSLSSLKAPETLKETP